MLLGYITTLVLLLIYSYALIDPNLTLVNAEWWEQFRNQMVLLGYHNRELSWIFYLLLVGGLYFFYFYFLRNYKKYKPLHLALLIGSVLLFSYPFLSHDLFNYMFDARILTYYGQNPYAKTALDFPQDDWLRFMHWTHRSYPYGPSFLIITLLPSILSVGKFILNFFFFKLLWAAFYLISIYYLEKFNKKLAIIFALHPFIIIEGLINSHNDLIAVSLAIVGFYYVLQTEKTLWGRACMLISGGIKYITLPLIFIQKKNETLNYLFVLSIAGLLFYLSVFIGIQSWYYLTVFALLPLFPNIVRRIEIFLFGLLMSYYPFIRLGDWGNPENVELRNTIIFFFFLINVVYLGVNHFFPRLLTLQKGKK